MRVIPEAEEQKFADLETLRGWVRSRWMGEKEAAAGKAGLGEPWLHGGAAVRFLLGGLCYVGQLALLAWVLYGRSMDSATSFVLIGFSAACWIAAEFAIRTFHLHRFGVEEALVLGSAIWFLGAVNNACQVGDLHDARLIAQIVAFCTIAFSAAAYARFGYAAAGVGFLIGVGAAVIAPEGAERATRLVLAAVFAVMAILASVWDGPRRERPVREFFAGIALIVVYGSLHLCPDGAFDKSRNAEKDAFYWATYAAIWILPALAAAAGIRRRSRALIAASIVTALFTLITNKPYLGLERNAWDPILLGGFLMAVATVLTRWFDAGENGRRGAFTAKPLVRPREEGLESGALAAAAVAASAAGAAGSPAPGQERPRFEGGGGSAGGAGASGGF